LRDGHARACLSVEDVWRAVGIVPHRHVPPAEGSSWEELSVEARGAYQVLNRVPKSFDEVLAGSQLSPAALTSALVELELSGFVIQHPGRLFERV
jgi:DNA processing protein